MIKGKIIAAVSYRDYVLVFTEYGAIYKIEHDEFTGISIRFLAEIPER